MPQASPVGPAPTTIASKDSVTALQFALHFAIYVFQRAGDGGCILAAAFRHVRPAAALAAYGLGHRARQLARMELAGQVLGDRRNQRDVAVVGGNQHYHGALPLIADRTRVV